MRSIQQIATSRLFIFDKRKTVRDVKLELFAFFRPILPSYKGGKVGKTEQEQIEEEYRYYFDGKSSSQ